MNTPPVSVKGYGILLDLCGTPPTEWMQRESLNKIAMKGKVLVGPLPQLHTWHLIFTAVLTRAVKLMHRQHYRATELSRKSPKSVFTLLANYCLLFSF